MSESALPIEIFRALGLAAWPCSFSAMVHVCCACFRPRDQVHGTRGGDEHNGARLELTQIPNGTNQVSTESWHDFPLVRYQPRKTPPAFRYPYTPFTSPIRLLLSSSVLHILRRHTHPVVHSFLFTSHVHLRFTSTCATVTDPA